MSLHESWEQDYIFHKLFTWFQGCFGKHDLQGVSTTNLMCWIANVCLVHFPLDVLYVGIYMGPSIYLESLYLMWMLCINFSTYRLEYFFLPDKVIMSTNFNTAESIFMEHWANNVSFWRSSETSLDVVVVQAAYILSWNMEASGEAVFSCYTSFKFLCMVPVSAPQNNYRSKKEGREGDRRRKDIFEKCWCL